MVTSHQPITISQNSGVPKGNQTTVALRRLSADEMSKGFKIPNQINIIPKEMRIARVLDRLIHSAIFWSMIIIRLFMNVYLTNKDSEKFGQIDLYYQPILSMSKFHHPHASLVR